MTLTGVHLLLTYQCTMECDHCFVWGSPRQTGTMSLATVREILRQARELGTVEWIYFEGGEPFLFHPVLVRGVEASAALGFKTGIVTNAYWATGVEEAAEYLRPLAGRVQDLSLSNDSFHGDAANRERVAAAREAAGRLGIPTDEISIEAPEGAGCEGAKGQLPAGASGVMCRGRAATTMAARLPRRPWSEFGECPYEDLRDPGRVHVDAFGHVHLCQGISIGNVFESPLRAICPGFDPGSHPIAGPLIEGGPRELVRRYALAHRDRYADACHLCYEARAALAGRFPAVLTPAQMYGVVADDCPEG